MTWKEIKDKIELQGVKDSDSIDYIDISSEVYANNPIIAIKEDEGWRISD